MFNVIKGERINRSNDHVMIKKGEIIEKKVQDEEKEVTDLEKKIKNLQEELKKLEKEVNLKREEILKAHDNAGTIVSDAEDEANELLLDTRKSLESKIEEIKEEAYKESYDLAYREAKNDFINEISSIKESFEAMAIEVENFRNRVLNEKSDDIAELSLKIASIIIRRETLLDGELVERNIREALKKVPISKKLTIIVNMEDLEHIKDIKNSIIASINGVEKVEIIENSNIERGGCIVETSVGTIDATIESQFKLLEERLLDIEKSEVKIGDE